MRGLGKMMSKNQTIKFAFDDLLSHTTNEARTTVRFDYRLMVSMFYTIQDITTNLQ